MPAAAEQSQSSQRTPLASNEKGDKPRAGAVATLPRIIRPIHRGARQWTLAEVSVCLGGPRRRRWLYVGVTAGPLLHLKGADVDCDRFLRR